MGCCEVNNVGGWKGVNGTYGWAAVRLMVLVAGEGEGGVIGAYGMAGGGLTGCVRITQ